MVRGSRAPYIVRWRKDCGVRSSMVSESQRPSNMRRRLWFALLLFIVGTALGGCSSIISGILDDSVGAIYYVFVLFEKVLLPVALLDQMVPTPLPQHQLLRYVLLLLAFPLQFLYYYGFVSLMFYWFPKKQLCSAEQPPTCLECGYNLTGNTSGICPECGTPIPKEAREKLATDPPK